MDHEFSKNGSYIKFFNKCFIAKSSNDLYFYDKDNISYRKIYCDPMTKNEIRKYKISLLN